MTSCTLEQSPTRDEPAPAGQPAPPARAGSVWRRAAIAAGCVVLLALLVGLSLSKHLDHDEHQFIASGALLARHGLLPYRDYAYFHMPYLVAIYAGLFRASDHLLLAARVFSGLCAFGTAIIVAFTAARVSRGLAGTKRTVFVLASVMLLIANPLFSRTTGRVWNHDLPTFLLLAAFVLLHPPGGRRRKGAVLIAGALMGVAVGARLTFAPVAVGLGVAELLASDAAHDRSRWRAVASYAAGGLIALLPAIACFVLWPAQFVFGNLTYTTLNTAYRMASGYSHAMTPLGKLAFIVTTSLTSAAGAGLVIGLCWIFYLRHRFPVKRLSADGWFDLRPIIIVLVAVLVGSLAPTPLFVMYLFTPYAVVVMLMLLAAAPLLRGESRASAGVVMGMSVAALLCIPQGIGAFRDVSALWDRRLCAPLIVHDSGVQLRQRLSGDECVLTTAPLIPLEGGLEIFPEFATGPFAMRIAGMVNEDDEARYRIVDEQDLEPLVLSRPHAVVLTTSEEPGLDGRIVGALSTKLREGRKTSWGGSVWIVERGQQANAEQPKR